MSSPAHALTAIGAVALLLALPAAIAGAQEDLPGHVLLDVPYLPQTPQLCGGAAVAMVLRYWGDQDVFPQDFESLVSADAGGILSSALASAVRGRGWEALVVPVEVETAYARLVAEIDRGRPVIALIETGAATYHYVVVVAGTDEIVVVHDPARAPFRVLQRPDFDRAWAAAGRWMMLVLPHAETLDATLPHAQPAPPRTPCSALVEQGVTLARSGDHDQADASLAAATTLCAADAAPWRELAGLRFMQSRWIDAQALALAATRRAPDDAHAWQIVAASRYLSGDALGALGAWNRLGEPRVDTITLHGLERTRQPVVMRTTGWEPREVLTPEAFDHGLRRLRDLPVVSSARIGYRPIVPDTGGGLAQIDVYVNEREASPSGWLALSAMGTRALLFDELAIDVAGTLGAAETVSAAWRWVAERPRVALGLALPSPSPVRGVVSLEGAWERQSYAATAVLDDVTRVREERRRIGVSLSDWATSVIRWRAGVALDRLRLADGHDGPVRPGHDYLAFEGGVDLRQAGDRLAVAVSGGWWQGDRGRFGESGLLAAWRSTVDDTRPSWSIDAGIQSVSGGAPLALWPGAGTGDGRPGLLRAHPLLDGGVMTGAVFGRHVVRGSLEYAKPVARAYGGRVSIAGFMDVARASHRPRDLPASPLYVDAGVGVRVRAPGQSRDIRIDLAHGLRGGGITLAAGWDVASPW